jgi:hypothetical protein
LPVRKNLHAKEGLCGHLARLRLLASGDPVERIESFFGGPGDDVYGPNSHTQIWFTVALTPEPPQWEADPPYGEDERLTPYD